LNSKPTNNGKRAITMLQLLKTTILLGSCTCLLAIAACDQNQNNDNGSSNGEEVTVSGASEVIGADDTSKGRLVQIATLNSPKANSEFTRNVQIMQARVREIANMNTLLAEEEDASAKRAVENQIKELIRRVNEDNKKMADTYRYSLNRNYIRNVEKATVFIQLSDEDVTAVKKQANEDGRELPPLLDSNLLSVCTLNTADAVQGYQKDVARVQTVRDEAISLQAAVTASETTTDKAYAQGRLDVVMDQLKALNVAMFDAYGFSINRNYTMQIDKSSLYIWAPESELANVTE
jgi:ribosomal protein L29